LERTAYDGIISEPAGYVWIAPKGSFDNFTKNRPAGVILGCVCVVPVVQSGFKPRETIMIRNFIAVSAAAALLLAGVPAFAQGSGGASGSSGGAAGPMEQPAPPPPPETPPPPPPEPAPLPPGPPAGAAVGIFGGNGLLIALGVAAAIAVIAIAASNNGNNNTNKTH
jgi:hypothetical protein